MQPGGFLSILRMPSLLATVQLSRDLRALVRLRFLVAAFDSGLMAALRVPATRAEAIERMAATRADLAGALIDLGVALGELGRKGDRYRLRGVRARALASEAGDGLAAWLEENVGYHGDVYLALAARLRGAEPGDYLEKHGRLIARSSRVLEPMIAGFVAELVRTHPGARLLEVGCGSGVYLRHAALADAKVTGVGIDLQPVVIEEAAASLARWGIAGRFRLLPMDIRSPGAELDGPFDLVTLYNNLYYFPEDERPELFRRLRARLAPGGELALVSVFCGHAPESLSFDIALRSTRGCTPLPSLERTEDQLREAGFAGVRSIALGPGELHGLVATAPRP